MRQKDIYMEYISFDAYTWKAIIRTGVGLVEVDAYYME